MPRHSITPWRAHTDLLAVRTQLYQLDKALPDERRRAVHRVMAWKLRNHLPHAVESTALLVDAILNHADASPDTSIFSIRAVYAAAFTRFVTGFCDIGRNRERSLEPSSMLDIAKQLNMPVHFVAVRHEATHEDLPSVRRLMRVCEEALQWLWNVYWSRLEDASLPSDAGIDLSAVVSESRQILKTFRTERLDVLRRKTRAPRTEVANVVASCSVLVAGSEEKMKAFADVLVGDKFLCPSKRALGSSLEGAFLIWDELLQGMISMFPGFALVLIDSLERAVLSPTTQTLADDTHKEAVSLWLVHIMADVNWTKLLGLAERQLRQTEVAQWCCMYPNHWTQQIASQLLRLTSQDFREEWQDILEASWSQKDSSDVEMADVGEHGRAQEHSEDALLERLSRYDDLVRPAEPRGWHLGPCKVSVPIGIVAK